MASTFFFFFLRDILPITAASLTRKFETLDTHLGTNTGPSQRRNCLSVHNRRPSLLWRDHRLG